MIWAQEKGRNALPLALHPVPARLSRRTSVAECRRCPAAWPCRRKRLRRPVPPQTPLRRPRTWTARPQWRPCRLPPTSLPAPAPAAASLRCWRGRIAPHQSPRLAAASAGPARPDRRRRGSRQRPRLPWAQAQAQGWPAELWVRPASRPPRPALQSLCGKARGKEGGWRREREAKNKVRLDARRPVGI